MEMKIKIPKGRWTDVRGGGFKFCKPVFMRVLQLDDDLRECFIIASVERPALEDEAIFTISKPRKSKTWYSAFRNRQMGGERYACLREIRPYFYAGARRKFAKLYDKGFRYLHVEYDS